MYLILLWHEFAFSSLLCKCLGLGGYCCETLVANVLDDRCNETIVSGDGNRNVRLVIPAKPVLGSQLGRILVSPALTAE
jgi:hypothetical protein